MKRFCILNFILFFVISCSNNNIKMLTDDANLLDAVSRYNLSSRMKIKCTLLDEQSANIFTSNTTSNMLNYDIIAGAYFPDSDPKKLGFTEIQLNDKIKNNLYKGLYSAFLQNGKTLVPYSADFPVIVALQKTAQYIKLDRQITFDEFRKTAISLNKTELTNMTFGFIPRLTELPEADYYFIGGIEFTETNNKPEIDKEKLSECFNLYNNFNMITGDGNITDIYIKNNIKTERPLILKKGILKFDMTYMQKASALNPEIYTVSLISDLKHLSLKQNCIGINSKSSGKTAEINEFINFLLSEDMQKNLVSEAQRTSILTGKMIIPANKTVKLDTDLNNYIDNLLYPNFKNKKSGIKFLNALTQNKEQLSKEQIKKDEFIKNLLKTY